MAKKKPQPEPHTQNLVWTTLADGLFQPGAGLWPVPADATVVDYAYALDPNQAQHLVGVKINGRAAPLSRKLKLHAKIELQTDAAARPQKEWLDFVGSPASELIRMQLGLPLTQAQRIVVQSVMHGMDIREADWPALAHPPKPIRRRSDNYVQPGREGKRLIGAYVPIADIPKFKSILAARGTNVQEFFAQVVANEIAASGHPAELEKLIENQLERFRATLRSTLKR